MPDAVGLKKVAQKKWHGKNWQEKKVVQILELGGRMW